MNLASEFANRSLEEIKELLNGGTLSVYSVARPLTADLAVDRSGLLVTFTFATPAFGPADGENESPNFVANPVSSGSVGTPGFVRACAADGKTVADFSAGPGDREIKFAEVSCSNGAPVRLVKFCFKQGDWPERPDYYGTHPRPGYPLPVGP
ncbi:hypothetical protein [Methylocystis sp. B8]|uniref:hypothetical protein n=1 Tax=Methylocystis sp. B8 TaxID=544938 RepID=UPI0010FEF18E|nr:hypothetical protein [Methylocystis sp. B8]TLG71196.1 hypothetical protein FEV16_16535 [Methylocystis sp. B8]